MPKGPKGQKQIEEVRTKDGKNPAAVALGRKGGQARAAALNAATRLKIAQKAARTRWRKSKG